MDSPAPAPEPNPNDFPSVDLAYELAVNSYDVALRRLEAVDGRLQTIMAFAVSTSAIAFSVIASRGFGLHSGWLYTAIGFMLGAIALGTFARLMGKIRLLEPKTFYKKWLKKTPWTFKKDLIYWAALDFDENMRLVRNKWRLSLAIIFLFVLEALCLAGWAVARLP